MELINFEIGVDAEEIERFSKYTLDPDNTFIKRIYTPKEVEYCFKDNHIAAHLAARFCAKEAAYKAISALGVKGIQLSDIEVLNKETGAPFINFLSVGLKNYKAKLSISHSKNVALASVVVFQLK